MNTAPTEIRKHRLSVTDYHRMADAGVIDRQARVELIEGEIFDMVPIGSRRASIVDRLNHLFSRAVGTNAIVRVQSPIVLGKHSEPEPDLCLLRNRDDYYSESHPRADDVLLVVEVASTSLPYDRDIKVTLYACHRIPEVWLIDVHSRRITLFSDPNVDGFCTKSSLTEMTTIRPVTLPDVSIDLATQPHGIFGFKASNPRST